MQNVASSLPRIPTPDYPGFGGGLSSLEKFAGGMGIGGLAGGLFGSLFEKDPYSAGNESLQQISPMLQKYYSPYIQAGQQAIPTLQQQYGQLMNDPSSILSKIGAGYTKSPGYQFDVGEATRGANQAAAAGGMAGSPAEQAQLANTITGLAGKDYGNYMGRALGLYGQGLSGEQGMMQTGYGAASGLGQNLADVLESQAQMQTASAQQQNQQMGGLFSSLGGLGGGIAGLALL